MNHLKKKTVVMSPQAVHKRNCIAKTTSHNFKKCGILV